MDTGITVKAVTADDVPEVAIMVGELLGEIMDVTGTPAFRFDPDETRARLADFIARDKYFVFVAHDIAGKAAGFLALYESHALYAEGAFGTIPELYVRPVYRSRYVGRDLIEHARAFGVARGWGRLEVTTPPLPAFDRTLAFYRREGFTVSGGRKLKLAL